MQLKRMLGTATAIGAVAAAVALYTVHPAKSSDHQDTFNLATQVGHNTSADITDVFVFPAPDNANNVVFAMDVSPLISPLSSGNVPNFDPTLLWQFKISHQASGVEDQVIQMVASGTGSGQTLSVYGPTAPREVGTTNTIVAAQALGSTTFGNSAKLQNNTVQFYAGPRSDPFVFDLFGFFTFAGDRNYGTHNGQSDPGPAGAAAPALGTNGDSASNIAPLTPSYDKTPNSGGPSFNGFTSGAMSTDGGGTGGAFGAYACSTSPASDTLDAGPFNVLSYIVEVPKSMLTTGFSSSTIHVWATVSSSTTNS